jgi:hypothetical protein
MEECIHALAEHYKVDLGHPDAGWGLVIGLACDWVEGFRSPYSAPEVERGSAGAPTKLDFMDTTRLLLAWAETKERLSQKSLSDRKMAEILADQKWAKNASVSSETIRKAMTQIRGAFRAVRRGKATEFQRVLVCEVLPFVAELAHKSRE